MKVKEECVEVCEFCVDEYDAGQAPKTRLYRLRGRLMCSDCANECEGYREFSESAYGVGE